MPTRTITEEFCDLCFAEEKQKETPATERVRFGWLGKQYVVLVCDKHVGTVRDTLQRFSDLGSPESGARRAPARSTTSTRAAGKTLFSQLGVEEKERFRAWADMPNARRIADSRVEAWIAAGRP